MSFSYFADYPVQRLNTKLTKNVAHSTKYCELRKQKDIIALVTLIWYRCRSQYHIYTNVLSSGRYNEYIYLFFYMNHFLNLEKRSLLKEFLTPVHIYVLFISYNIITLNKGTFFFHHAYINKMIFFFLTFLSYIIIILSHMNYDKTTKKINNFLPFNNATDAAKCIVILYKNTQ